MVTNKTAANGANSFSSPSSISGITDIGVTLVAGALGGAEPESIDSIKLSAPLDFALREDVLQETITQYLLKNFFQTHRQFRYGVERTEVLIHL